MARRPKFIVASHNYPIFNNNKHTKNPFNRLSIPEGIVQFLSSIGCWDSSKPSTLTDHNLGGLPA